MRFVAKPVAHVEPNDALRRQLESIARYPVRDLVATSDQRIAFSVDCGADCESAMRRLGAEPSLLVDVSPDARMRIPERPLPSQPSSR